MKEGASTLPHLPQAEADPERGHCRPHEDRRHDKVLSPVGPGHHREGGEVAKDHGGVLKAGQLVAVDQRQLRKSENFQDVVEQDLGARQDLLRSSVQVVQER